MATIRSAIDCLVIPAILPIADAGDARVRFPGIRRLDPQVRATGMAMPFARLATDAVLDAAYAAFPCFAASVCHFTAVL